MMNMAESYPKIVLVNAPMSRRMLQASFEEIANILPPLGIGYVAAVLEQNGFNVKIIDCLPTQMSTDELVEELKKDAPDLVGFTSTTLFIMPTIEAAQKIKKEIPNAIITLGGAHVTALPQEAMQNGCFDIGVIGEGEYTTLEIAQAMGKAKGKITPAILKEIKGTVFRDKSGKLVFASPRPYIQDLDSVPFPARHLFPGPEKYSPVPASCRKLPYMHLMSSRGCPYRCIFCDKRIFGNTVRMRSPKNVVDEIGQMVKDYRVKEVRFFDDTFTFDEKRTIAICDEIIRRKLGVIWTAITRVNHVSPVLLKKMKEAGCWQISFGLESGSQKILNIMRKGITLEQSRNAINWTKKAGMGTRAYFVFGMPGETKETIKETVEFAKSLPLDVVTFYNVTLLPGNDLYEIARREGKILHDDYTNYNPSIDGETKFAYVPKDMTEDELRNCVVQAHKDFYLRPGYILRELFSARSLFDLVRYWRGFKVIVKMGH